MPPNQVLIGLALFLSLFIMTPVINDINTQAYTPYYNFATAQIICKINIYTIGIAYTPATVTIKGSNNNISEMDRIEATLNSAYTKLNGILTKYKGNS
jgi:hypothetical protein